MLGKMRMEGRNHKKRVVAKIIRIVANAMQHAAKAAVNQFQQVRFRCVISL